MVASDFAEYDVVITTYGTLSAEYMPKGKAGKASPPPVPRPFGLYSVKWRRIVLDEGVSTFSSTFHWKQEDTSPSLGF